VAGRLGHADASVTLKVYAHALPERRSVHPWQLSRPTCECDADWRPGLVLDPFFGAGTTGLVAEANGRDWLGIELNPEFAQLGEDRIKAARKMDVRLSGLESK
jgi:site-specific DNA-methyltransferase (adenine-specific)